MSNLSSPGCPQSPFHFGVWTQTSWLKHAEGEGAVAFNEWQQGRAPGDSVLLE